MNLTQGPWVSLGRDVISSATPLKTFVVARCARATDARVIARTYEMLKLLGVAHQELLSLDSKHPVTDRIAVFLNEARR